MTTYLAPNLNDNALKIMFHSNWGHCKQKFDQPSWAVLHTKALRRHVIAHSNLPSLAHIGLVMYKSYIILIWIKEGT